MTAPIEKQGKCHCCKHVEWTPWSTVKAIERSECSPRNPVSCMAVIVTVDTFWNDHCCMTFFVDLNVECKIGSNIEWRQNGCGIEWRRIVLHLPASQSQSINIDEGFFNQPTTVSEITSRVKRLCNPDIQYYAKRKDIWGPPRMVILSYCSYYTNGPNNRTFNATTVSHFLALFVHHMLHWGEGEGEGWD